MIELTPDAPLKPKRSKKLPSLMDIESYGGSTLPASNVAQSSEATETSTTASLARAALQPIDAQKADERKPPVVKETSANGPGSAGRKVGRDSKGTLSCQLC
jgi:hypothetical protein